MPDDTAALPAAVSRHGCRVWSAGSLADPVEQAWSPPHLRPEDVAYLQYTSGSTSMGKGVVVTHDCLTYQLRLTADAFALGEADVVVSWLPLFHDFGLVAGLLMPLLLGGTTVKMPPEVFVQRPLRWLSAISRYGATASFSPNFVLDLCSERITEEDKRGLDLSRWRVLGLGAEPIRPDTLDRFTAAFSSRGFRHSTHRVVYGMAEATLLVTIQPDGAGPPSVEADPDRLAEGVLTPTFAEETGRPTRTLIANGTVRGATDLRIVDPDTHAPLPDGGIGEVWMRGRTVAAGYWQSPEATEETFGGYLPDGSGPYLRSGDLGAMHNGELYLTGRLKDLIIVRGRNVYPQDVELTLTDAHPALRRGLGVAFAVETGDEERLVVVQELKRTEQGRHDLDEVARQVRAAVTEAHDVSLHTLVLLPPGTLPKTTSGKVRRRYTRQRYVGGELEPVHVSDLSAPPVTAGATEDPATVAAWLREAVAGLTGRAPREVDSDVTFGNLGMDSAAVLSLTGDLATWLGRSVDPTLLYAHPTIARFADAVAGGPAAATPRTAP
ncbi:AMP-binding protein, partial [Saccharomonospora saliphila]|uniref:AMP-binding protein n=1 Tax=Saccharomonospora saliphila TaxID=369829 RepID=UPI0018DCA7DA